ncbi:MAG TPA: YraN family protein [Terriglobales bacterium]|jgi:putative endonuclease
MVWLTKFVIRSLEFASRHLPARRPKHLLTGKRGELEAYLHLRGLGYKMVAANFRVPYDRGEIDLIGWDNGILCFIEVKTRTNEGLAPPVTAVDRSKRRHILSVARRYVRRIPGDRPPCCRFDIVSIILEGDGGKPQITVHKGAFSWDADRPRNYWHRDFRDRHFWPRRR